MSLQPQQLTPSHAGQNNRNKPRQIEVCLMGWIIKDKMNLHTPTTHSLTNYQNHLTLQTK